MTAGSRGAIDLEIAVLPGGGPGGPVGLAGGMAMGLGMGAVTFGMLGGAWF